MTAIFALLATRWGERFGIIAGVLAALHFAAVHYRAEGRAQVRSEWQAANAKAAREAALRVTSADTTATASKGAVGAVAAHETQQMEQVNANRPEPIAVDAGSVRDIEARLARVRAAASSAHAPR